MPKKQCSQVGCLELIDFKNRFCEKHSKVNHDKERYRINYQYDKEYKQFYNSASWRKLRKTVMLEYDWMCQECLRNERYTIADVVDHIIEIKDDWDKRLDKSNLEPLCHTCHNAKTARERRLRRNG